MPLGVYYIQPSLHPCGDAMGKGMIYTCIGVGLSALLVSTNWAMREPLNRGTGNKGRLHVFFIVLFLLRGWRGERNKNNMQ